MKIINELEYKLVSITSDGFYMFERINTGEHDEFYKEYLLEECVKVINRKTGEYRVLPRVKQPS